MPPSTALEFLTFTDFQDQTTFSPVDLFQAVLSVHYLDAGLSTPTHPGALRPVVDGQAQQPRRRARCAIHEWVVVWPAVAQFQSRFSATHQVAGVVAVNR